MDQLNNPGTEAQTLELVEHEGVVVTLGKRQYVLPPMTIKTRRMEIATRKALEQAYNEASEQDLMVAVLHETLKRNYPSMLIDVVESATYDQIVEAYALMKEEEARLVTEVGKRLAQARESRALH